MFCNQCEQHSPTACKKHGICGKNEELAHLQDSLIYSLRLLAQTSLKAEAKDLEQHDVNSFMTTALYSTLTNVNFSETNIREQICTAVSMRKQLAVRLGCTIKCDIAAIEEDVNLIIARKNDASTFSEDVDVCSAMQTLLYGLKGVCAYAAHAAYMGKEDSVIYTFLKQALSAGFPDKDGNIAAIELGGWLDLLLECGKINLRAMELLEAGHTEHFGHPTPAPVKLGHKQGKAILVSGHDMLYLYKLLEQTADKGISVYTHGEMIPAHGYPKLREFKHLAGHYGTAWQNQQKEMVEFPGAILFTSNCIQNPRGYAENVFTCGTVRFEGITHFDEPDFSALIEKALSLPGFESDEEGKEILAGFGRQTLLDAAPQVLDAVKQGALKHIFLVGGCDGARPGRNYYTEFVEKSPQDSLILTLGCGKYRFFDKDLGKIGPFPRLMDVGQCNDAYAAIQVAVALANALDCGVNDLPLSLIISWYEQKAVSVLLSLLALGVKNIHLGPSLPAFISPNVLNVLVENWDLKPVSSATQDLERILNK